MKPKDKRPKSINEYDNPLIVQNSEFEDVNIMVIRNRYPNSNKVAEEKQTYSDEVKYIDQEGGAKIYMNPLIKFFQKALGESANENILDDPTMEPNKEDPRSPLMEQAKNKASNISEFSSGAMLFMYTLSQIQIDRGYVKLNHVKASRDIGIKKTKFYEGIEFLSNNKILEKMKGHAATYWINPYYFFYGDRATFFVEKIMSYYNIVSEKTVEHKNPKKGVKRA